MAPSSEPTSVESPSGVGGEQMVVQPTLEEQEVVSGYEGDMDRLATDFETNMTLSTGPDCDGAGDLRDAICDLSARICDIAERHPGWQDVESKCEDATQRCERARNGVADRCEEE